jgi:dipeptidyl aminopeptidase/acylaminoacyl peptidase
MNDDLLAFRSEPDPAFADRLERLLVRRFDLPVAVPTAGWSHDGQPGAGAGDARPTVAEVVADGTRPPRVGRTLVAAVVAAALVAGLVVAVQLIRRERSDDRPGESVDTRGLIAFVGGYEPIGSPGAFGYNFVSDIYVVNPDGTGLHALTATPGQNEIAPAWSPDGAHLAFLRDVHRGQAELVVVDPYTGTEELRADVPMHWNTDPATEVWTPDGRSIVVHIGNDKNKMIDLATKRWTVYPQGLSFSPDGKQVLVPVGRSLALLPARLVSSVQSGHTTLPLEARIVVDSIGLNLLVDWLPDSSAFALSEDGRVDVVTIADGRRRTLLNDASSPTWSPDGSRVAFLRDPQPDAGTEVWVASADGSGARQVATSAIAPTWSPDGAVLLLEDRDGLFTVRPDGTDKRPTLPAGRFEPAEFSTHFDVDESNPDRWSIEILGPAWQRVRHVAGHG